MDLLFSLCLIFRHENKDLYFYILLSVYYVKLRKLYFPPFSLSLSLSLSFISLIRSFCCLSYNVKAVQLINRLTSLSLVVSNTLRHCPLLKFHILTEPSRAPVTRRRLLGSKLMAVISVSACAFPN